MSQPQEQQRGKIISVGVYPKILTVNETKAVTELVGKDIQSTM